MKLIWLDLETTGLDADEHSILEIAVSEADFLTPFDARPLYHAVLRHRRHYLEEIHPVVVEMHTKNGLWGECEAGFKRVESAHDDLLALIPQVEDQDERPILAGATVHFDHGFLKQHMPILAARFSYRHYDVSTIKLFCRSLGMPKLAPVQSHRAQADVLESIAHGKACADWLAQR